MKKKILGFFVSLLAIMLLATPLVGTAMAKEKVYAEFNLNDDDLNYGNVWITNGGIQQQKDNTGKYYGELTIGGIPFEAVIVSTISATYNTETGYFAANFDSVCYVSEEGSDSGFKGIMLGIMYDLGTTVGLPFSRIIIHGTLQGFGNFEGQTLKLSTDGDFFAYFTWTGYCIK